MKRWRVDCLDVAGNVVSSQSFWTRWGAGVWVRHMGPPLRPFPSMPPMWSYAIARNP